ncbi:MAG: CBS domain-containing protein, partial [Chloroflexota bacterium]
PLDGGRVLRAILWMITGNLRSATSTASSIGNAIGYLFILGGLFVVFVERDLFSGIWLAFIGWFLHNAATASYRQATMDSAMMGVEVRSVMDQVTVTAPADLPVEALIYRHLLSENRRAVPVVDADSRLLGLITIHDTQRIPRAEWSIVPVSRVMMPRQSLATVTPQDSLRDALRVLAENDYHQLPVVLDGRLVGMLHRGHVLQYLHVRQIMTAQGSAPDAGDEDQDPSVPPEHRAG